MRDPGLSKAMHIALDLAVALAVVVGPIVLVVLYHVGVQVAGFWERASGLRPRRVTREMGGERVAARGEGAAP